ncbi:hypothetical protein FACS1894190_08330 [Spirochaetia bacterium]|nr:hypothetical protein FACS1894190_08330 [Spirochaetia bacterium]
MIRIKRFIDFLPRSLRVERMIDGFVPVTSCNLRCHYCYVTQQGQFNNELPWFPHLDKIIGTAFSKKRLGGICYVNLCAAGETLLPPETTVIIRELLKAGHYVWVVTNGTITKRFDELLKLPKGWLKRLAFKMSFHYLELKRLNLLESYFNTIKRIRKAGCSFSVELTPCDEYIPHIKDIQKICMENAGAVCHVTVGRDTTKDRLPILTGLSKDEYIKMWSAFNSALFDYKISVFGEKQNGFCYAGDYTSTVNLGTGDLKQCYEGKWLQNIYQNIKEPIKWEPIGCNCPESHCYNAHAFLTLGAIPDLNQTTPTYADMRNRICADGAEWLTPKMKAFIGQKIEG